MHSEDFSSPDELSSLHRPKARWSVAEDEVLRRAVEERGPSNWNAIAVSLTGRTGKQCRERWITKLSPAFTSETWTPEEDEKLITLQSLHGNQWAKFRAELPRRSTISIKNRWVSLRRRESRTAVSPSGEGEERPQVRQIRTVPDAELESDPILLGFEDCGMFEDFSWYL
jgi:hypothetical protein